MNQSMMDTQQRFLQLFEPVQPQLQRFVLAMTRDEEIAKDIIGETILIAFERIGTLRHDDAFLSFLFTIATRVYRKRRKELERTVGLDDFSDQDVGRMFDETTPPDVAADIAALYRALERLPEKQREAVILYEVIGLSTKEIREAQGGTLVGVRVRIARARKKLARLLGVDDIQNHPLDTSSPAAAERSLPIDDIHLYSVRTSHE